MSSMKLTPAQKRLILRIGQNGQVGTTSDSARTARKLTELGLASNDGGMDYRLTRRGRNLYRDLTGNEPALTAGRLISWDDE